MLFWELSYCVSKEGAQEDYLFDIEFGEELDLSGGAEEKMEILRTLHCVSKPESRRCLLSKLEEGAENLEDDEGNEIHVSSSDANLVQDCVLNIPQLSTLMKNISIGKKSWRPVGSMQKSYYATGTSSGNRSANEQLLMSSSFVKLADMSEEEWVQFLENYQKLLRPAFANRKTGYLGERLRQRLGTSCKF